jgi:serine/alanine adding enzyme
MIPAIQSTESLPHREAASQIAAPAPASTEWRISPAKDDAEWDDFLGASQLGHFQQSSLWGLAKSAEGWQPLRMVLQSRGRITGGFQILWRRTRLGRIGYIYKGPVLDSETPDLIDAAVDLVKTTTVKAGLRALVLQAPDGSKIDGRVLGAHGFVANHVLDIIRATLLVDLTRGMDAIGAHIRRSTWAEIRKAQRRGIVIREGGEQDVRTFFQLMLATCARQRTQPSPPTAEALLAVYRAYHSRQKVRLTLAEFEGEPVAGGFCITFGSRVTFWKKGWSGGHRERHPHQLLQHEAVEWACKSGFKFFDFAALRQDIAVTLLKGEELSDEQRKARDFINLSHGDVPVLLPEDRMFVPNRLMRLGYETAFAVPSVSKLLKRFVRN